jgi:hypothetical protein
MRRRKMIFATLALALCGVLATALWLREPVYEGVKLHAWAESASTNAIGVAMPVLPDRWRKVFQSVGPQGVPFYLKWLGYKQSRLGKASLCVANRWDRWFGLNWDLETHLEHRAYGAALAFTALGENGQEAIPTLLNYITNSTSASDFGLPIMCLSFIGRPAIPPLLSLSTNSNYEIRDWSIGKLTRQWSDERVIPQLTLLLQHPDYRTRAEATNGMVWLECMLSERNYVPVQPRRGKANKP